MVVLGMSTARGPAAFAALILLTRGFGQSALSVVSLTIVGKSFPGGQGPAMGIFSFLIGIEFAAAVSGMQFAAKGNIGGSFGLRSD